VCSGASVKEGGPKERTLNGVVHVPDGKVFMLQIHILVRSYHPSLPDIDQSTLLRWLAAYQHKSR
jgi:hypothetical protein